MSNGLITLTTDFGTADHFVAAMKGVILTLAPRARMVDITHEITPYDVNEAGFVIAQAWSWFPKGTVHVVVVDPGVGSSRQPILVEAAGHYFVGPDNGVFSMIYAGAKHKVRVISNPKMMLSEISRTFHGRDIFAPAAGHLVRKVPPVRFGKAITDYVSSPLDQPGVVLKVDRFGNLITNLHITHYSGIKTRPFELRIGREKIHRLALTYSETEIGEVSVIVGSSGYLEIAANQENAAKKLGCGNGTPVELKLY
ncbi:MAG: SAM-dependent chlorinase/fluorinase [Acidobacteriia bacterium]|nr:SAM-dependent chlorinase/fluorinase [Terriglobia bacterium]